MYVCAGGDCAKPKALRKALVAELDEVAEIVDVRCQSICVGPVAGLDVDGRLEWFERLRKPKTRRSLARLAARRGGGGLPERLAKRRVAKRSGRRKR